MVSHELRTPLTSIKGSASTIMDAGQDLDPAVVRQFVRIIGDQAEHMNALVADLLDVARIETGTLAVGPEPAEVAVLLDRARNGFANAGGKNSLAIDVEPGLPLVMADRRRIVQVLGNLLFNAARNSPESSVIRVSAVREGVYVAVSVADEGTRHPGREPARPVPQVLQGAGRGAGRGHGAGSRHLQGHRGGARGPNLGRERRAGNRGLLHLHAPIGRGPRQRCSGEDCLRSSTRKAEERVRVLAVDDDPNDLRYVRDTLARSGYDPVGGPGSRRRCCAWWRPRGRSWCCWT